MQLQKLSVFGLALVVIIGLGWNWPQPTALAAVNDDISVIPSPDGHWTARLNQTVGSLTLCREADGQSVTVFPAGDSVFAASWSPDSQRLLVVRTNWQAPTGNEGVQASSPIEIWQIQFKDDQPGEPARLYQSAAPLEDGPQQIVLGHWSPDSRYVLFWEGILSASILSDGLPLAVLDVTSGQVSPVAEIALLNPRYQSWSPDSTRLAVTAGGYRSAQVDKWLTVWNAASGTSATVISQTEQIPGTLAWSPGGDTIAYAAVPAKQTSPDWADWMAFDNPAIAARRIYLLDPASGQYRRLNRVESYQDAPVWSSNGATLYYVQLNGDMLEVMAADPATGYAEVVPGYSQSADLKDPMQANVGYYGQFGREELLADLPTD